MSKTSDGYHPKPTDPVSAMEQPNENYSMTTISSQLMMTLDSLIAVPQQPQLYTSHYQTDSNTFDDDHQLDCQTNINSPYNCNSQEFSTNEMLDFNPRNVNFSDIQKLWFRKDMIDIFFRIAFVAPIILLGIAGNLTIIYSMCKFKPFRTKPTNIFILNMAIADLLTTMVCPIAALVTDIYQFYVLGSFLCRFEGFIKITCLLVKSYSLIVLSCEWLLCVVKPCRTRITIKQSWFALATIWILSILMASPLFVWRKLRQRLWKDLLEVWCCELIQYTKYYWVVINFFLIYLPTFFMTVVLIIILIKMDKFEAKLKRTRSDSNQSNLSINMKYRRRIVKILITYLLTSFICWTPFQFTIIYRHFRSDPIPAPWFFELTFFAQLSASLTAAMNPIIFGFLSQPFRRILTRLVMFKFLEKIIGPNTRSSENPNPNNHALNQRNLNNHNERHQRFSKQQAQAICNQHNTQSKTGHGRQSLTSPQPASSNLRVSPVNVGRQESVRAVGSNSLKQFLMKTPDVKRVSFNVSTLNTRQTNGSYENTAFNSKDDNLADSSQISNQATIRLSLKNSLVQSNDGLRRTNTTSFMQREHNLYPSSFVSMDSINIEENLGNENGLEVDDTS